MRYDVQSLYNQAVCVLKLNRIESNRIESNSMPCKINPISNPILNLILNRISNRISNLISNQSIEYRIQSDKSNAIFLQYVFFFKRKNIKYQIEWVMQSSRCDDALDVIACGNDNKSR